MKSITIRSAIVPSMISLIAFTATSLAAPGGGGGGSTPSWSVRYVPGAYATIQDAVDAASSGDIIEISSGYYIENVAIIDKNLTLRCPSGLVGGLPAHIRPAGGYGTDGPILSVSGGSSVSLEGLAFQSSGSETTWTFDGRGVTVHNSQLDVYKCSFHQLSTSWIDESHVPSGMLHAGAAIDSTGAAVTVNASRFVNCKAHSGGAISANGGSLVVSNSRFNGCRDIQDAGAINAWNADGEIKGCRIVNCGSTYGSGALQLLNGYGFKVERCIFQACYGEMSAVNIVTAFEWANDAVNENYFRDCWRITPNPHAAINMNMSMWEKGTCVTNYICGSGPDPAQLMGVTPTELTIAAGDCSSCVGDVSFDGERGVDDLLELLVHWGEHEAICDLNEDGWVGSPDLNILLFTSGFGGWCD